MCMSRFHDPNVQESRDRFLTPIAIQAKTMLGSPSAEAIFNCCGTNGQFAEMVRTHVTTTSETEQLSSIS